MKRILGSLILLTLSLWGRSAYHWDVSVEKQHLYLHEATQLTMTCVYEKEGKNDDVEFAPPKDIPFEFKLLREERSFVDGRQHIVYEYLLFARAEGQFTLKPEPRMLFTTQSAIDNIIIGRDNVKDLEVEKEIAKIDPIVLEVKGTGADFSGNFTLDSKLDHNDVSAFEPVHLQLRIKGKGNLQDIKPFSFEIDGVEVFSDKPEVQMKLTPTGYEGEWVQRFAFVSDKPFRVPSVEWSYFDLETQALTLLKSDSYAISIKAEGITRESLVDTENSPSDAIKWSEYTRYGYYMLSFILGFMLAKLWKLPSFKPKDERLKRISGAKDAKTLLSILIQTDAQKFHNEISRLEASVYEKKPIDFAQLKKEAKAKI